MNQKIIVDELQVDCVIGVYEFERKLPQRLVVSSEIVLDHQLERDRLDNTLNYEKITHDIKEVLEMGQFRLIESAVEKMVSQLSQIPQVSSVWVKLKKPGALPGARGASFELKVG